MLNRDLIFFKILRVFTSSIEKNYICPPTLFILKPFLYFAILLFMPFILVAQGNYKHGYIVDAKGDTLHGFIDFREWISSPVYINFKTTTEEGRARKIGPSEITSFSIDGLEAYQSYSGPLSMDGVGGNHISSEKDTSIGIETVFLKLLQKGHHVALLSFTDEIKTRFFIQENTDVMPRELVYRDYYKTEVVTPTASRQMEIHENTYLKQLYFLAEKNRVLDPDLASLIGNAGYYAGDLLKVISKINGISETEYNEKYHEQVKIHLVAGAGLNFTATQPFGSYQKAGGINYSSMLPFASIGVDFFANPKTQRLFFRSEFSLTGDQYKSSYIYTGSPYVPVRYSYDRLCAAITPQVIYSFYNAGNFKIYGGFGLAITLYKYSNGTYDLNYAGTQVKNAPLNGAGFLNTSALPILLKAGIGFNRNWGIFVNYLTPTTVSPDSYFQIKTHPLMVGLNYSFE